MHICMGLLAQQNAFYTGKGLKEGRSRVDCAQQMLVAMLQTTVPDRGCHVAEAKDAGCTTLQPWAPCGAVCSSGGYRASTLGTLTLAPAHLCTTIAATAPCVQRNTLCLHPPGLLQLPVSSDCFALKPSSLYTSPVQPSDHMLIRCRCWLNNTRIDSSSNWCNHHQGTVFSTPDLAVVMPSSCSCAASGAARQDRPCGECCADQLDAVRCAFCLRASGVVFSLCLSVC